MLKSSTILLSACLLINSHLTCAMLSTAFKASQRCSVALTRRNGRLFGSRPGAGGPPGNILIENEQTALTIETQSLQDTISRIRELIGYPTYDVALYLIDDKEMKAINKETRGVNAPTDILSFQVHPTLQPGKLVEPDFDIPDYYILGDMMVDVPYVMRRCEEDKEYEDDEDDKGVSGAMAKVFDPEKRIHMLLVHGMLHLVGYDHETDEDFELMVAEEERILQELGYLERNN